MDYFIIVWEFSQRFIKKIVINCFKEYLRNSSKKFLEKLTFQKLIPDSPRNSSITSWGFHTSFHMDLLKIFPPKISSKNLLRNVLVESSTKGLSFWNFFRDSLRNSYEDFSKNPPRILSENYSAILLMLLGRPLQIYL